MSEIERINFNRVKCGVCIFQTFKQDWIAFFPVINLSYIFYKTFISSFSTKMILIYKENYWHCPKLSETFFKDFENFLTFSLIAFWNIYFLDWRLKKWQKMGSHKQIRNCVLMLSIQHERKNMKKKSWIGVRMRIDSVFIASNWRMIGMTNSSCSYEPEKKRSREPKAAEVLWLFSFFSLNLTCDYLVLSFYHSLLIVMML